MDIPEDAEVAEAWLSYWQAWQILTNDRPLGAMGGAGRIPWSSIDRHADQFLYEDSQYLAGLLWAMDSVYLEWLGEQQKKTNAD